MSLPLFDFADAVEAAALPFNPNVRPGALMGAWEWTCRGCGSRFWSHDTRAEIEDQPVCCWCRAEAAGVPMAEWKQRPRAERVAQRVPLTFKARRTDHRNDPGTTAAGSAS